MKAKRNRFTKLAFTKIAITMAFDSQGRRIGLPEPIYEYPQGDYFVKATIPFYHDKFEFFKDGTLLYAELPEGDAERVREIISNTALRLNGNASL